MTELVSIITPTRAREPFLPAIARCVATQDYPRLEWLVLDDSPEPSRVLADRLDLLDYVHVAEPLSIGAKRNRLVNRARGSIIVQFDDDDHYAPGYVSALVAALQTRSVDLVNLRAWYLYDLRSGFFGYWNLLLKEGLHFCCDRNGVRALVLSAANNQELLETHLGYGFGYAYRRAVWQADPFPETDFNEDLAFAQRAALRFRIDGLSDTSGLCLHVMHAGNASRCFPQYQLPNFLLPRLFPGLGST